MSSWTYERLFEALEHGAAPADLEGADAGRLAFARRVLDALAFLRPTEGSGGGARPQASPAFATEEARPVAAGAGVEGWRGVGADELSRFALEVGELELGRLADGTVVGQAIERPDLRGGTATLFGDDEVWSATLDDRGRFAFQGVGAGAFALLLERDAVRVVLRELELGDSDA